MIIDAHQHLWQVGRNAHAWPTPDLEAIYRDFGTDDLASVTAAVGVTATVLVQSQPSAIDTDWMLRVAQSAPLIRGVVGWADLAADDAGMRLADLARQPKLKGVRPMLQGLDDDEWILRDAVQPALKALCDLGLRFDALIFARHLKVIDRLARAWPDLAIVIDHCAKPPIGGADATATRDWRDDLARVAQNANVFCKLSGLVTEMAPGQDIAAIAPYADHALAVFGPERLMWGSDWPVVNLRTRYDEWFAWTLAWLGNAQPAARDAILGGNAQRFYQLS